MPEFLHVRRLEKENRFNVYWGVVKVCVGSMQYRGTEIFVIILTLDIVQIIFFSDSGTNVSKYMFVNL